MVERASSFLQIRTVIIAIVMDCHYHRRDTAAVFRQVTDVATMVR